MSRATRAERGSRVGRDRNSVAGTGDPTKKAQAVWPELYLLTPGRVCSLRGFQVAGTGFEPATARL